MAKSGLIPSRGAACRAIVFGVLAASLHSVAIEQKVAVQPSFEVASVRQVPEARGFTVISPMGTSRFSAHNATLLLLIEMAFDVQEDQIAGAPAWLGSALYDVDAKPEGEFKLTYEELKPRLRQLLVDRFSLKIHREVRPRSGYQLVVAKSGPKLVVAVKDSGANYILPDTLQLSDIAASGLAAMLGRIVGEPVIDKTGLPGQYDIKLKFAPQASTDSPLPSIFTALEDELGLKLERQKIPVEVLVLDRVEKVPTEN